MQSYSHLTKEERTCLVCEFRRDTPIVDIAKILNRSRSTIYRELKRNNSIKVDYSPIEAQRAYEMRRKKCKRQPRLRDGTEEIKRICRRLLRNQWSPEIISNVERTKYGSIIGVSSIYRAIKAKRLGAITEQNCLRRRGKRRYCRGGGKTIQPLHSIHERPAIIEQRGRIGDWEGDTVLGGVGKGALLTLVDRKTRFLIAHILRSKQAKEVANKLSETLSAVKTCSLTLDNGAEFALFREIEDEINAPIYFADTHSPWQRGSNENLNGLLRWYFPKGYDFRYLTEEKLRKVVKNINDRPRKCLGWKSPAEVYEKCRT